MKCLYDFIGCHQRCIQAICLRHKHTVEWIVMRPFQITRQLGINGQHRQFEKPVI